MHLPWQSGDHPQVTNGAFLGPQGTCFPYSLMEVEWEVSTREQGRQGGGPGPAPPSLLAQGPTLVTCASRPCACHLPPPLASLTAPKDHAASDPGKAEYSGAVHPGAQVDRPGDEHQVPPLAQSCALRQSAPRSTVRKPAPIPAGSRFYSWGTHQNEQPHREDRKSVV